MNETDVRTTNIQLLRGPNYKNLTVSPTTNFHGDYKKKFKNVSVIYEQTQNRQPHAADCFPCSNNNQSRTGYPASILLSGYLACFSGIRLSDRLVRDIRPNNPIITTTEIFSRVAKYTLENKNILEKFHVFTTSPFKIKGALTQMKSNNY